MSIVGFRGSKNEKGSVGLFLQKVSHIRSNCIGHVLNTIFVWLEHSGAFLGNEEKQVHTPAVATFNPLSDRAKCYSRVS